MYSGKQILNVSYPIFLGLLAQNVINVTDTAFLGRVGEVELGASAMGGLYYISVFTIAFGFSTGSQIVIARRNGEGRYDQIGPVMTQGVFFLLALATLAFLFSRLFAEGVMGWLISSDAILKATMDFLDWRVIGFFFSFMSVMFRALYVGITRTKVLTINAVLMAVTNVVLDFLVVYTRWTVDIRKYALDKFRSFDLALLGRVLNISVFMMLQYFLSIVSWFMFFIAVEHLGQRELAIANIVRSIYVVMLIPVNALATTTNTFVSNSIGARDTALVIPIIRKICHYSLGLMVGICALFCLIPEQVLAVYTNDLSLIAAAVPSLYVIIVAMLIAAVSCIIFNGVSGTGNTRSALFIESSVLVLYVLFIYITGMRMRLPVAICFGCEIVYYTGMLLASALYLKKANWQNKRI